MPGFKDALKAYKANTSATPAVNPPEAPAIMEKQTEPETEGKPEPAPLEVSKPAAKTRAPRGSSKKSAEPAASTASVPTTDAPESDTDAIMREADRAGRVSITINGQVVLVEELLAPLFRVGFTVRSL